MRKAALALLLVGLLGLAAACGSDDEAAPETQPAASTPADTGTVAEEPDPCARDQLQTVVDGSLTMQLFWVRPPDDPRVLDLPGYRDPGSGPKPLVVYGSASNDTAEPVDDPTAVVVFLDAAGQPVATFATEVLLPGSTDPAATLAPGGSGDVIFVIEGSMATTLADLTPELRGGAPA